MESKPMLMPRSAPLQAAFYYLTNGAVLLNRCDTPFDKKLQIKDGKFHPFCNYFISLIIDSTISNAFSLVNPSLNENSIE